MPILRYCITKTTYLNKFIKMCIKKIILNVLNLIKYLTFEWLLNYIKQVKPIHTSSDN